MPLDLISRRQAQIDAAQDLDNESTPQLRDVYEQMWGSINKIQRIELSKIRPYKTPEGKPQPRSMSDIKIERIIASAQENGQLQPIIVRKIDDVDFEYEILCGHHRFFAFKKLNWTSLDAVVVDCTDNKAYKILAESNIDDAPPSEQGEIYNTYMKMRGSEQEDSTCIEIAQKFNVSKRTIYRYINLLKLLPDLRVAIDNKILPIAKAEKIISCLTELQQLGLAEYIDVYDVKKISPKNIDKLCECAATTTAFDNDMLYDLFHSQPDNEQPDRDIPAIYTEIADTFPKFKNLSRQEIDDIILRMFAKLNSEEEGNTNEQQI